MELSEHAWLGRVYKKLTEEELRLAIRFMGKNHLLSKGEFELAVNRMFLDASKPRHFKEILELLTCANSLAK